MHLSFFISHLFLLLLSLLFHPGVASEKGLLLFFFFFYFIFIYAVTLGKGPLMTTRWCCIIEPDNKWFKNSTLFRLDAVSQLLTDSFPDLFPRLQILTDKHNTCS